MFSILFVCSGNQYRSPSAESFVRHLATGLPLEVASAGTLGIENVPAAPEAITFASSVGVDLSGHKSRPLTSAQAGLADLVCGFELIHVSTAVVEGGASPERTFTLPEIVKLLEAVGPSGELEPEARARDRVARAHSLRVQPAAYVPGQEIADPIGRSQLEQERTLRRIWELCGGLVEGLFEKSRERGLR